MSAASVVSRTRWLVGTGTSDRRAAAFVAGQLVGGWALSWWLGGAAELRPVWAFIPVLYAGVRFGVRGSILAAAAATIVAGPALPLDTESAHPQPVWLWASRGFLLVLFGLVVTGFLERRMAVVRSDRIQSDLDRDLALALERNEFTLHYQPILSVGEWRIVAVEALLRWEHPRRGAVPPADFIPAAEESGAIHALGAWVIDEALRQTAWWDHTLPPGQGPIAIAVNVSARQLCHPNVARRLQAALRRTSVDPALVHVEVTETSLIDDLDACRSQLEAIRELGVGLAVDDFGTGHASLSYLRDLPVDIVKIDRTFVAGMISEESDRQIVASVIELAHSLGKVVVAEGVETAEQADALSRLGCDFLQGWYVGHPEPAVDLARHLAHVPADPSGAWTRSVG